MSESAEYKRGRGGPSARSTVRRNDSRAVYDQDALYDILDSQLICTVAYVEDGEPRQIATLYIRDGDYLYLHGNRQAALLRHMAAGGEVCVGVMCLDGVVVARSGFHCSMNYRSVTVFGQGEAVTGAAHGSMLDAFVDRLIPGHAAAVREPTSQELAATSVVRLKLDEMSAKVRGGDPIDAEEDIDGDTWAGQIPLSLNIGAPIPSADLRADIAVPEYVAGYRYGSGSA